MIKELGQITDEVIEGWAGKFDKREIGYFCKECGSQIMQITCYVSIHDNRFSVCAGGGDVMKINYPYCPQCDGETEYARACYHG